MEPRVAVQDLLDSGRGDEAYAVLQDILLSDDSWEMLMLAGRAARATGRPLEAVDFYEKAIARSEHLAEAHEEQFDTLVSEECRKSISRLIEHKEEVGRLVDERVWRDFRCD